MKNIFIGTDKSLFFIIVVLSVVGFLILASASAALSEKQFGVPYYYIVNQFMRGFVPGIILFLIGLSVSYTAWRTFSVPFIIASLILMVMVFMPDIGFSYGGATRWITIGPITFQPSEILKLALIIYLASWLESRKSVIQEYSATFIPFIIIISIISVFLVLQPDLGTLAVIGLNALFIYLIGGSRWSQTGAIIVFGLIAFFVFLQFIASPYSRDRMLIFLNPGHDPLGKGYQVNQAQIAIGSGGFWGRGIGESTQKYGLLPEPVGDSIFAVFAEEFGFVGGGTLVLFFIFFLWRGLAIAARAPNVFGRLLATGIVVSISIQAFINIGANSGILPLTGIPLPFISYGGTSLAMTMASMGILLNISKG
ncbi:MAG: putative lipid II flippase FtsW [Patescibacteria group bacterium]